MEDNNDEYDTFLPGDVIIINLLTSICFIPFLGDIYSNYRCLNKDGTYHRKTSFREFYFGK